MKGGWITPSHIENAHSIDFGDFDIIVYLEKHHSFITLFLQSDKYTFMKMGVFNVQRCKKLRKNFFTNQPLLGLALASL
jgi:hypothetical protein